MTTKKTDAIKRSSYRTFMTTVSTDFHKVYSFEPQSGGRMTENAFNFASKAFSGQWDIKQPGRWSVMKGGWTPCQRPEEIDQILNVMNAFKERKHVPFKCYREWSPSLKDCVTIEYKG